jgi:hypothetical protein
MPRQPVELASRFVTDYNYVRSIPRTWRSNVPKHSGKCRTGVSAVSRATSDDEFIGLQQASKLFPGRGGVSSLHPATLTRWICRGVCTRAGRVRLRAVKIGSVWATRRSWLEEFQQAVTDASIPPDDHHTIRSANATCRDARAAVDRLAKAGCHVDQANVSLDPADAEGGSP